METVCSWDSLGILDLQISFPRPKLGWVQLKLSWKEMKFYDLIKAKFGWQSWWKWDIIMGIGVPMGIEYMIIVFFIPTLRTYCIGK